MFLKLNLKRFHCWKWDPQQQQFWKTNSKLEVYIKNLIWCKIKSNGGPDTRKSYRHKNACFTWLISGGETLNDNYITVTMETKSSRARYLLILTNYWKVFVRILEDVLTVSRVETIWRKVDNIDFSSNVNRFLYFSIFYKKDRRKAQLYAA